MSHQFFINVFHVATPFLGVLCGWRVKYGIAHCHPLRLKLLFSAGLWTDVGKLVSGTVPQLVCFWPCPWLSFEQLKHLPGCGFRNMI